VSGKDIPQDGRDEPKRKSPVGDPPFELGFLSVGFVEVDGIKVSNGLSEELDILLCDPFGEFSGIADLQFLDGFPFSHKFILRRRGPFPKNLI
jgi:hypothetical protein